MRERTGEKAKRYLGEGRLVLSAVDAASAYAVCRGEAASYRVAFEDGRWSCNCPALGRCAHMLALGLVTSFEVRP